MPFLCDQVRNGRHNANHLRRRHATQMPKRKGIFGILGYVQVSAVFRCRIVPQYQCHVYMSGPANTPESEAMSHLSAVSLRPQNIRIDRLYLFVPISLCSSFAFPCRSPFSLRTACRDTPAAHRLRQAQSSSQNQPCRHRQ